MNESGGRVRLSPLHFDHAEVVEGQVCEDGTPLLYHSGAYGQPEPLDYEI